LRVRKPFEETEKKVARVCFIFRNSDGVVLTEVCDEKGRRPLPHVPIHSPTGFEMGYQGSGPADLALAVLCEALRVPPENRTEAFFRKDISKATHVAWDCHQRYKRSFVAKWHTWATVDLDEVEKWAAAQEGKLR